MQIYILIKKNGEKIRTDPVLIEHGADFFAIRQ